MVFLLFGKLVIQPDMSQRRSRIGSIPLRSKVSGGGRSHWQSCVVGAEAVRDSCVGSEYATRKRCSCR